MGKLAAHLAAVAPMRARRRLPVIQANGSEYLVTINGAVFLALSLAGAETIAYRMSGRPRAPAAPVPVSDL